MPKQQKPILDFDDGFGVRCVLTKKNWLRHQHHPEMRRHEFVHHKIRKVIENPDYIYPSHQSKYCFCFYLKEVSINDTVWYTKVIVQKNKKEYIILTGWLVNIIHEVKYNKQPLNGRP